MFGTRFREHPGPIPNRAAALVSRQDLGNEHGSVFERALLLQAESIGGTRCPHDRGAQLVRRDARRHIGPSRRRRSPGCPIGGRQRLERPFKFLERVEILVVGVEQFGEHPINDRQDKFALLCSPADIRPGEPEHPELSLELRLQLGDAFENRVPQRGIPHVSQNTFASFFDRSSRLSLEHRNRERGQAFPIRLEFDPERKACDKVSNVGGGELHIAMEAASDRAVIGYLGHVTVTIDPQLNWRIWFRCAESDSS